jgi:cysteinyl-tRNA synthetase
MCHKYLGENFDIHCGGVDLKFPHHENEIAQSRCAFERSGFARFWFHVGALMVGGQKMSKSLGNFITIGDLRERGIKGATLRHLMFKNHYRKPFDFREDFLQASEKSLSLLHKNLEDVEADGEIPAELLEILCDDVNTSNAIALLEKFRKEKRFADLKNSMICLGIYDEKFHEKKILIGKEEVEKIMEQRKIAKINKNWTERDRLRLYLQEKNVLVKDSGDGADSWEYA